MSDTYPSAAKPLPDKVLLSKPQVNLSRSSVARMWLVSLCSFMAIVQSSLTDNFSSLILAAVAVLTAVITEIFFSQGNKFAALRDGSSVATALILTLFLPNQLPPVYVVMGTIFAIAVVKYSFGGIGANWLNPAVGGWFFIRAAWSGIWNRSLEGADLSLSGDGLTGSVLSTGNSEGIHAGIRQFFNDTIFSITGSELPGGYVDLFASVDPGIIADRGILALLIGTIIITASTVNRSWIPAVWIGVYVFFARMTGALSYEGGWWHGDIVFSLFTGGVIAAAFILNADPVTSAKSTRGILIATVMSGLLAWFFRYHCGEPYGAVYAVAAVNVVIPIVRTIERRVLYDKR